MDYLIYILWNILPAGTANATPPVAAKIFKKWNTPVDFGLVYKDKEILGNHKTVRGIITGTAMGQITFLAQRYLLSQNLVNIRDINFLTLPIYYGALIGFFALFGDLIISFIKRQLNVASGKSWFPWDQIDWVIGYLFLAGFYLKITVAYAILSIAVGFVLHLATKAAGYLVRVNKTPI